MSELTEMQKQYLQNLKEEEEKELTNNADLINSFKQFSSSKGINLVDDNFKYIQTIGIVACSQNIVGQLCPDFTKGKEGLIDFNFLSKRFEKRPFANGYLYADKFMVMAHPFFRRGFYGNNNFAPRFTELFWGFNHSGGYSFIAIDYDRVRINVDNIMYFEEDTWYGARFDEQINKIDDGIVKLRPPSDIDSFLISFCFADAYSLDIKWETRNGIKSFQAEEFKTDERKITINGQDFFPVRYIHAEFDLKSNMFRHFDGAIHLYSPDEYYERRDSDFNYNAKHDLKIKSASEKLFKLNGDIPVDTWIEFSSHFMSGNPLVIEYFEGKYPDRISEILDAVRKSKNDNGASI